MVPGVGAWRSPEAHRNGVAGVGGSNPPAPTPKKAPPHGGAFAFARSGAGGWRLLTRGSFGIPARACRCVFHLNAQFGQTVSDAVGQGPEFLLA